jgi:hypothetical protein
MWLLTRAAHYPNSASVWMLNCLREQAPTVSRARDDLSRDFYRVLTELGRHQAWRQSQQMIDIIPKSR